MLRICKLFMSGTLGGPAPNRSNRLLGFFSHIANSTLFGMSDSEKSDTDDDNGLCTGRQRDDFAKLLNDMGADASSLDEMLLPATGVAMDLGEDQLRAWRDAENIHDSLEELEASSEAPSRKIINATKRVQQFETKNALDRLYKKPAEKRKELAELLKHMISDRPELVPEIQSAQHDFGAPTRKAISDVRQENVDVKAQYEELRIQHEALKEKAETAEKARREVVNQMEQLQVLPQKDTNNLQLKQLQGMLQFMSLPRSEEGREVQYDILLAEFEYAQAFGKKLKEENVRAGAEMWLTRIKGLTEPTTTDRSARDQSISLLICSHTQGSTHSLADIHALAYAMKGLPANMIIDVLTFLQGFLRRKRDLIVVTRQQISVARSLILLRSIELICDHIQSLWTLNEVIDIFQTTREWMESSRRESRVVQAFFTFLDDKFNHGFNPEPFTSTVEEAAKREDLATRIYGRDILLMDGENLLIINQDVHFVRPDRFKVDVNGLEGFYLQVQDFPALGLTWVSPFWVFDANKTEFEMVLRVFSGPCKRMEGGNKTVVIKDSDRVLMDN
jgi:hypothetical protein